ncbi:MAG: carbon-nitrogen hydrolase family protein [Leifsonia sp.]|uniref:carbon-nitrogen hydrolase family protein n=1 Tax=Leifsonia sp. TaxID=1870902 RepID=UPI003F7ED64F
MPGTLTVAAVQTGPQPIGADLAPYADAVARHAVAGARLVVHPELHLFGADHLPEAERTAALHASAVPLDGDLVRDLGAIARESGVWLVPGSICERGPAGELFNTALAIAPDGSVAASYRKIFPWRPFEPYVPGDRFVVFDLDGSTVGLDICYDAWFPEVSRHLAWMGAEAIVNVVKTTTPDREQEVVLARANSIANQVFTVSVNTAGPVGRGRSIVVDPEGAVLAESPGDEETVLTTAIDLDHVARVREHGTAGVNRMWSQFRPGDAEIPLPLYGGRIDPATWAPPAPSTTSPRQPLL